MLQFPAHLTRHWNALEREVRSSLSWALHVLQIWKGKERVGLESWPSQELLGMGGGGAQEERLVSLSEEGELPLFLSVALWG